MAKATVASVRECIKINDWPKKAICVKVNTKESEADHFV